mmetsp:Transcript_29361/g.84980  ORF Transcript_29361/g.84980 Transcript_29361/m.84980 type:complete len:251 (-) Transcript_29361:528-1280(-)
MAIEDATGPPPLPPVTATGPSRASHPSGGPTTSTTTTRPDRPPSSATSIGREPCGRGRLCLTHHLCAASAAAHGIVSGSAPRRRATPTHSTYRDCPITSRLSRSSSGSSMVTTTSRRSWCPSPAARPSPHSASSNSKATKPLKTCWTPIIRRRCVWTASRCSCSGPRSARGRRRADGYRRGGELRQNNKTTDPPRDGHHPSDVNQGVVWLCGGRLPTYLTLFSDLPVSGVLWCQSGVACVGWGGGGRISQ